MTLLTIKNVSLTFGTHVILRDVNATIEDRPGNMHGHIICFLGPKGIGKTQLSRIIAGLQAPTSGSVMLSDGHYTRKGRVGMVSQSYPLFEYATVTENLAIAGRQAELPLTGIKLKTEKLLETFDITQYADYYPSALSGGTRQCAAIAQQLMCTDHYLVMDEPFSGLDPIMKHKAAEMVAATADLDERNTIIIVTHDIIEGLAVADTVWLMGLEPNPTGGFLPGARLVETYDLASMDLCWHSDIGTNPKFLEFVGHIKQRFLTLR